MKTKTSFVALLAAFVLAGCHSVDPVVPVNPEKTAVEQLTVFSADVESSITRTGLSADSDGFDIVWSSGDHIWVNAYDCAIQEENLPEGYGPGYTKALFSGFILQTNQYRAWYPTSLGVRSDMLTIPSVQNYVAGGIDRFPMYAASETESFSFKNICGVIRLNLKGTKNVTAIGLLDVADSPKGLSGGIRIEDNAAVIKSGTAGVTLTCATPVALNADTFTSFMITVPAESYGKLQITITADDGTYAILKSNKTIVVERSKITDINLSSLRFKTDQSTFTYTTTGTTQIARYNVGDDASVFGEGLTVVGHTYDSGTKTGVITLSGTATTIGQNAFSSLGSLKTMTIPETVRSIGYEGFYDCRYLESINWPPMLTSVGNRSLLMCNRLTSADISHLTYIGDNAFQSTALTSVTFDSQLTHIGTDAFRGSDLTSVVFNAVPAEFYGGTFYSCNSLISATFNCNVPNVPAYAFYFCDKMTSVTFAGTVGTIGEKAFYCCKALTNIDLTGTGVTSIGVDAFRVVPLNASFAIPSTVTSIGQNAFFESGIVSVTLNNTSIGRQAFDSCTDLESLTLVGGSNMTAIPYRAFNGCGKLTSANIPSSVTSVSQEAFRNCGLTQLPEGWDRNGITYDGDVFYGCPVKHITFPDTWTTIPANFCSNLPQLLSVEIGTGVTSFANTVFQNDTNLATVTIRAAQVPTLNSSLNSASGAKKPLIYVPAALIDTYKAANNWSQYEPYFRPIGDNGNAGNIENYNNGGNL